MVTQPHAADALAKAWSQLERDVTALHTANWPMAAMNWALPLEAK